jgi:hypothetical protein
MIRRIRIPGRLAAAAGLIVLAVAPAPASAAGFVTSGKMTLTLTAHTASALSHGRVLIYPVGPVTVKGASTATGDRTSHVAIVKTSPSFAVGLPVTGGTAVPDNVFVTSDGGFGFASIVRGQSVFLSQFSASISTSFTSVLLATFGTFDYGSFVFAHLDTSHATFTPTATGTRITGLKAVLVASSARALNQALGTSAFSSGSVFATVKVQTREV